MDSSGGGGGGWQGGEIKTKAWFEKVGVRGEKKKRLNWQRKRKPEKDCQGEGGEHFYFSLCGAPQRISIYLPSLLPLSLSLSASNRDSLVMFPPPGSLRVIWNLF